MASTRENKPLFEELANPAQHKSALYAEAITKSVLDEKGGARKLYTEIMRDDQVKSTWQQRTTRLTSLAYEVVAGGDAPQDQEAADFMEQQLKDVGFPLVVEKMHHGVFYGFAAAEMLWGVEGGKIIIEDIKVRDKFRFQLEVGDKLTLKAAGGSGVVMPERKFWLFKAPADNDDVAHGLPLAHWLYWPCFFKRNDIRLWLLFLDKFGAPSTKGKYAPNATDAEKKMLLEAAAALRSDAAVVIPNTMELELIEAVRSASGNYDDVYDRMDAAIAKVILSQTMTTDDGASLSQAKVHEGVADAVVNSDARLLAASWNTGPGWWLTAWNFPNARLPQLRFITEEPEDQAQAVARDQALHAMGWALTEDKVRETYGEGYERAEAAPAAPGQPPQSAADEPLSLSEADALDIVDRFLIDELNAEWAELMTPVIDPVLALAREATGFDDFIERVTQGLPEMDVTKLTEHLARAAFNARLAAVAEVDGDA